MVDEFTERFADLLTGSYDCVDRIVLNAYFPLGHNPGGFRVWWRQWHDDFDDSLDNAHLMRLAGRFARRVRASAAVHGIPVMVCRADERKHRIAEEYLREHDVQVGVFLILVARAPALVWKVTRTGSGKIRNLEKTRQFLLRPQRLPGINNGIASGGLFTGAEQVKTPAQAAIWGGTAGEQFDPCYHLACDTFENVNLHALDVNSDLIAYAQLTYAYSTQAVNGVPGKEVPGPAANLPVPAGTEPDGPAGYAPSDTQ